jgi:hypothetical protein
MNRLSLPAVVRIHTKKARESNHSRAINTDSIPTISEDAEVSNDSSKSDALLWYTNWPNLVLVFDCETTIDETQKLLFGNCRVYSDNKLIYEALFYNDDLSENELNTLKEYVNTHFEGDIGNDAKNPRSKLALLSRTDFIKKIFNRVGFYNDGVIVGFNLPFDISRVAVNYDEPKKGNFKGGFIFHFKNYEDKDGILQIDQFFPRVGVKAIDTKRSIISFLNPSRDRSHKRHGHFVDLRTFTYALTGKSHSLNSACEAFGLGKGKLEVEEHGKITHHYIDYCRTDVYSTWRLYKRTIEEYKHHPISIPPDKLYSAASLGKGYLQTMNVVLPELLIDPDLGVDIEQINGYAMQSYYGGRVECCIRKVPVPVVYCDFLSMYPTVNTLIGLWDFLTAEEIHVSDATEEVKNYIKEFNPNDLFKPENWKMLSVLVCIRPDGDFLPVRSSFSGNNFSIAWSYVHLDTTQLKGLWYSYADLLASIMLTGKIPNILKAIRLTPVGKQETLRPVNLAGLITIDPAKDDFFAHVIVERKRVDKNNNLSAEDKNRLNLSLKILANSTSYGIFVELNPDRLGKKEIVRVYSDCSFKSSVGWYEKPGKYFFPILGTFITSGAHLMLALAQYEVNRKGGVYAFMDTDSIAIVASNKENNIEGIDQADLPFSIPVLSISDVNEIVSKFANLNPYDRSVIPGSVLKIEDENNLLSEGGKLELNVPSGRFFYTKENQPINNTERLYCLAISSKRYVLFNKIGDNLILRKASEHGLGMYLSPITGDHTNEWIEKAWLIIASGIKFNYDDLKNKPALTRLTMTTPNLLRGTAKYNKNRSANGDYQNTIKPFNFLIHPISEGFFNPHVERVPVLVAPFSDPDTALNMEFVDLHEPDKVYRIKVNDENTFIPIGDLHNNVILQIVKSYSDILIQYPLRREAKLVTSDGKQSLRNSFGLLHHPHIMISGIKYIGKETNMLDEREIGLAYPEEKCLIIEPDEWEAILLPLLKTLPNHEIADKTGLSRRQIIRLKQGKHRPHDKTMDKVKEMRDNALSAQ